MSIQFPQPVERVLKLGAAGFVGVFGVLNVEFLMALAKALFVSAPQIFTGVSIGFLTLPKFLPPSSTTDWLVLAAAVLFGAYLAYKIWQNFDAQGLT